MGRSVLHWVCVCALGVMPLAGCSETAGDGGSGGSAGIGGTGGNSGNGGAGGTGGADLCEGVECSPDNDLCTDEVCDPSDGMCVHEPVDCDDRNDCTVDGECDPGDGSCTEGTPLSDGTGCAGGACVAGQCVLSSSVLPCTDQGIRNAVAAGGGPYTFDCDGPTTVTMEALLSVEKDVSLDGGGNLTIAGFVLIRGALSSLSLVRGTVSGVIVTGPLGTVTLTNSTVSGSQVAGLPAVSGSGAINVSNSTVSGNGGDAIAGCSTTIESSTIIGGVVPFPVKSCEHHLTIGGSLISGGCAEAYKVTSNGYNIESPGDTCGFDQPSDQVNVSADDLNLGPLQDNGGPTMTHALLPGSVAIDVIPAEDCVDAERASLTTDQRGFPRDSMCDVGAFEVQP